MPQLATNKAAETFEIARARASRAGQLHHIQMMLMAAGVAGFCIVAVAATVMTSLL
ncbi:hypothetical protein [Devosia aquimaris]|uniref:hypothetical protein n=1 Tax=Devosia aquimaris TaxID=2866214 RepID=UPI001CD0FCDF|nr:hypothetical protein [Devosia sp. CJK-A8-3]